MGEGAMRNGRGDTEGGCCDCWCWCCPVLLLCGWRRQWCCPAAAAAVCLCGGHNDKGGWCMGRGDGESSLGAAVAVVLLLSLLSVAMVPTMAAAAANKRPGDTPCRATLATPHQQAACNMSRPSVGR